MSRRGAICEDDVEVKFGPNYVEKGEFHRLISIQMPVMPSLMNAGKHIYRITLCVCVFMYARLLSPVL